MWRRNVWPVSDVFYSLSGSRNHCPEQPLLRHRPSLDNSIASQSGTSSLSCAVTASITLSSLVSEIDTPPLLASFKVASSTPHISALNTDGNFQPWQCSNHFHGFETDSNHTLEKFQGAGSITHGFSSPQICVDHDATAMPLSLWVVTIRTLVVLDWVCDP